MIKILFSGVVSSKKNPKSKEFRYFAEKIMAITKKNETKPREHFPSEK